MNKTTKVSIIIILIITIFTLVVLALANRNGVVFKSNKDEGYIIVGQNAMFSYHNKKFYNVPMGSYIMNELDWQEFRVLEDYKVKGDYLLHYDEKWYLFSKDKKAVHYESDNIIALTSNYNMHYVYKEATEIVDNEYVNKVADEKGVLAEDLTVNEEVHMDIDNDNKPETFYLISTALPVIPTNNKEYSIVFMVKDKKIYPIYDNLGKAMFKSYCKPKIEGFIDLNGNNNYEVILSCSTISPLEQKVIIYEMATKNGQKQFEIKAFN
jgi:hypothetical protein